MCTVPDALGNKIIHPFSDFLLHDVGTGDGIYQAGPTDTVNKLRTAPLWGLGTRSRYMHDLKSQTLEDAIRRHAGEASGVVSSFRGLSAGQRLQIISFLQSLSLPAVGADTGSALLASTQVNSGHSKSRKRGPTEDLLTLCRTFRDVIAGRLLRGCLSR
jgi:hypothetical protein